MEKKLSLLPPIWCRRKTLVPLEIRRRGTSMNRIQSINKQPSLRRRLKEIALFARAMSIGQLHTQSVHLSKRRN
jgi:hypothetical protein